MRIMWWLAVSWCCGLVTIVWAAPESRAGANEQNRLIENRPDVMERIRQAVENMGKQKSPPAPGKTSNQAAKRPDNTKNAATNPVPATKPAWGYAAHNGPALWASLHKDYRLCQEGQRQSPIAIQDSESLSLPGMEALAFEYYFAGGLVTQHETGLRVILPSSDGEAPQFHARGQRYRLQEIQFHAPGEFEINGNVSPLQMYLVHQNAMGESAMVVVPFIVGADHPVIEVIWAHLPLATTDQVSLPPGALALQDLLPSDRRYYQFLGSLTQPPCREGVLWHVFKQPLSISQSQLSVLMRLIPNNARPLQPLNGRVIKMTP
ncbi:carbonic anhydrase [Parvibium lacunae]|uniref:carbonic anhydrase n=1 Tax=Parvibium lacunae TaxID=1888893 RepID=A0A368L7V7_9BURK|nr:carbonic anhydrase family protein [Parvibium lacunae]RCS59788.1 carbonic anhydrase family protein [Parvibium lacunae]